uniref:Uncharacterized protein n=1 Tax=Steinernema glaseri TaxID=37863 RepID=A0A1I7YEK5_9BILA
MQSTFVLYLRVKERGRRRGWEQKVTCDRRTVYTDTSFCDTHTVIPRSYLFAANIRYAPQECSQELSGAPRNSYVMTSSVRLRRMKGDRKTTRVALKGTTMAH